MKLLIFSSALLSVSYGIPALAQNAQDDALLGDIIVTANRTESLLSKTPIAMSAVTGKELTSSGVSNPTQLDTFVPNLAITRGDGLQITIRGVTSGDNTEKGDPSAAFMLNGIYIARPQAQEVSFFDIERVEVLRGPQGTLYGRNSTAGVVNVMSARPKPEFHASFDASYANYNNINATAVVNVPTGNSLAFRAAVNIDRRDNFTIDGNPGDGVSLNPYKNNISGRLSALFEPSDALSVLVVGDYSKLKGATDFAVPTTNFYSNIITGSRPTFDTATYLGRSSRGFRRYTNAIAQQSRRDNDDKGVMSEIDYDFGPAKITYLGSYRDFKRGEYLNYGSGSVPADFFGDYWETSHELRVALTGNGPLQAQAGAYYFKEKSNIELTLYNLLGPDTGFQFLRNPTSSENKSVFGQATYAVMPELKLTGGVRYSRDTKSRFGSTVLKQYSSVQSAYNLGTLLSTSTLESTGAKRTFSKVTWRAGIDYDSPLGLIFASVSTGYKAGGFNDGCEIGTGLGCTLTAAALYYQPETLTAYEGGVKLKINPQIRFNGTVFHYDYHGLQLTQVANICGPNADLPCRNTRNAASAKVDGVELDTEMRPSKEFTVRLSFNYLKARYLEFTPQPGINFSGRPLDLSPKFTWSAGMDYRIPVGDGNVTASALTRFSSRYELTDLGNYAYFYQPSFTKTDVSLTYNAPGGRFYVGAFAKNLENNVVVTGASSGFFGTVAYADPRQFGVRAGTSF